MASLDAQNAVFENRYIPDYGRLRETVDGLKRQGLRVVLTQGVFDLLHIGHARYLAKAKEHGDVLVVGVDSDALTRSRKEPNRPIVPQEERLRLLAELRSVDILTLRDVGVEINELTRIVRPHTLIASETTKDFPPDVLTTLEGYCGRIIRLPSQATTSTTARIRNMEIGGADLLARHVAEALPDHLREILPAIIAGMRDTIVNGTKKGGA